MQCDLAPDLLCWRWAGREGGWQGALPVQSTVYEAAAPLALYAADSDHVLAAIMVAISRLRRSGFTYLQAMSRLTLVRTSHSTSPAPTYRAHGVLSYTKEDLLLRQPVHAPHAPTLPEAVGQLHADYDNLCLHSSALVDGGRGLQTRAREHAAAMLRRAGPAAVFLRECEVDSRANPAAPGRPSTARRTRFLVSELVPRLDAHDGAAG